MRASFYRCVGSSTDGRPLQWWRETASNPGAQRWASGTTSETQYFTPCSLLCLQAPPWVTHRYLIFCNFGIFVSSKALFSVSTATDPPLISSATVATPYLTRMEPNCLSMVFALVVGPPRFESFLLGMTLRHRRWKRRRTSSNCPACATGAMAVTIGGWKGRRSWGKRVPEWARLPERPSSIQLVCPLPGMCHIMTNDPFKSALGSITEN